MKRVDCAGFERLFDAFDILNKIDQEEQELKEEDKKLKRDMIALDKDTIIYLTNHSYLNLKSHGNRYSFGAVKKKNTLHHLQLDCAADFQMGFLPWKITDEINGTQYQKLA